MSTYLKLDPAISSGAYGITYYAKSTDMEDENIYVIKEIKLNRVSLGQLYIEIDSLNTIKNRKCRNDILCIKEYYIDYEKQTFNIVTESFIKDDMFPITLGQYIKIKNKILSEYEILIIMIKLCDAILYIHNIGIGHGDIKPENILINDKLDIQIIDFGLSCTRECRVGGTPIYESPEMLETTIKEKRVISKEFQQKSDIFSLGIVFYLLANGKLPSKEIENVEMYRNKELISEILKLYKSNLIRSKHKNEKINNIINRMIDVNSKERITLQEAISDIKYELMDKMMYEKVDIYTSPMDIFMGNYASENEDIIL